ncbi:hypothetical protein P775_19245 [Puniceibacterium antarcticum]|uniref:Uncharacterized protein n=1 Tax=Puniceibacterium antarcticum TaxID=1206336 RepID=A0A2G8RAY5_9RHOB|nr:hypothetical protein P775_19245 [Puniceibacterium antarcticum]
MMQISLLFLFFTIQTGQTGLTGLTDLKHARPDHATGCLAVQENWRYRRAMP